jgi:hypothetical protein
MRTESIRDGALGELTHASLVGGARVAPAHTSYEPRHRTARKRSTDHALAHGGGASEMSSSRRHRGEEQPSGVVQA